MWAGVGFREAYESYKAEFIREPEAVRRLRRMQQQQRQDGEDGTGEAKWNKPFPATAAAAFGEGYTTAPCDSRLPGCEVSTDGGGRLQSDSSIPLAAVKDHVSYGALTHPVDQTSSPHSCIFFCCIHILQPLLHKAGI